jgi:4-hydroxybenzoate polyprenyltransferase
LKSSCDGNNSVRISGLKLFFALSRTPHGLIDIASPALGALLCLGMFPPVHTVILGLITAFSGYTAVYALNDVVDYQTDKEKVRMGGYGDSDDFIDGVLVRHPLAKGILSLKAGFFWVLAWGMLALAGAYLLNPVCVYIFIAGCILEIIYCRMFKVSPLRTLASGLVKSCGALAAAFAVNPEPSPFFLITLLLWIFFWEIGGQNIPNDWTDLEEDRHLKAQTIPVRLGRHRAGILITVCLLLSLLMNLVLFLSSPLYFGPLYYVAAVAVNLQFLLVPAVRLNDKKDRIRAMALFNKASYFPLAMLSLVLFNVIFQP